MRVLDRALIGRAPAAYQPFSKKEKRVVMGMKLSHAVQSQDMGMWTFDVKADVVHGDPILALYFGISEEEASRGLPLDVFLMQYIQTISCEFRMKF